MKNVFVATFAYALADAMRLRSSTNNATDASGELPGVEMVMRPSQEALRRIAGDSRKLSDFVAAQSADVRASLTRQRASYEKEIAANERANNILYDRNLRRKADINATFQRMEVLRHQNEAIAKSAHILRVAFKELRTKANFAEAFLNETSGGVDALSPVETNALRPPPPEPTMEYFLDKARTELGLTKASLLQVGQTDVKAAQVLLPKLAKTLDRISQAQQHGLNTLSEKFEHVNQSQAQRHQKLLNWTTRLNYEQETLDATAEELGVAKAYLTRTNSDLRERLQRARAFQRSIVQLMDDTLLQSERACWDVEP